MSSINSDEIISILKEEIENFDTMCKDSEVGTVVTVGDGIATIYGIDHAMYWEIVTFENGRLGTLHQWKGYLSQAERLLTYDQQFQVPHSRLGDSRQI